MLRFFENQEMKHVGAALGVSEDAAKKRVSRALEKVRRFFLKRGVDSTAATIGESISANSIQAAPVALAKAVTAVALAKGAAASTSTLTLIQGALKIMAWTKAKTAIVTGAIVLLAAGTATVTLTQLKHHDNAAELQVLEIIRTNNWNYLGDDAELNQLIAIGPKAIPVLSNLVEWREPTTLRLEEKFFVYLPAIERRRLQDVRVRRRMHQNAVQIVNELGPAAIRPLNSSLCRSIDNSGSLNVNYAVRSLYWTIPESPQAIAAVTNWLADPTHRDLFGTVDCWDLYPLLPNITPSLINCLRNEYLAREAAIGLGMIGTNADAAIPALIEVCGNGVAKPPIKPDFRIIYGSNDEPLLMNRCAAYEALGKIGVVSVDVLEAENLGLADTNEDVRFAALKSLAALPRPLSGRLTNVLMTFPVRRSIKLQEIIEWVGNLKEDGQQALPWLRQFAQLDSVQKLAEGVQANTGNFAIPSADFRLSAIIAICRITPEAIRQYMPDLITDVGHHWEPVQLLMGSKTDAPAIVNGLEPVLGESNQLRSAIAAYVILGFEPQNSHALAILRSRVAQGRLSDRIIAAQWLWERTGETNSALTLCEEGLAAHESFLGQDAAQVLEKMGPAARPAVPALQAALWHKDRYVREYAGKALRKIAPDEMPPIL